MVCVAESGSMRHTPASGCSWLSKEGPCVPHKAELDRAAKSGGSMCVLPTPTLTQTFKPLLVQPFSPTTTTITDAHRPSPTVRAWQLPWPAL